MFASKIFINIKLLVLKITTLLFLPKWLFRHHNNCLCDKQRLYSALSYLTHEKNHKMMLFPKKYWVFREEE